MSRAPGKPPATLGGLSRTLSWPTAGCHPLPVPEPLWEGGSGPEGQGGSVTSRKGTGCTDRPGFQIPALSLTRHMASGAHYSGSLSLLPDAENKGADTHSTGCREDQMTHAGKVPKMTSGPQEVCAHIAQTHSHSLTYTHITPTITPTHTHTPILSPAPSPQQKQSLQHLLSLQKSREAKLSATPER